MEPLIYLLLLVFNASAYALQVLPADAAEHTSCPHAPLATPVALESCIQHVPPPYSPIISMTTTITKTVKLYPSTITCTDAEKASSLAGLFSTELPLETSISTTETFTNSGGDGVGNGRTTTTLISSGERSSVEPTPSTEDFSSSEANRSGRYSRTSPYLSIIKESFSTTSTLRGYPPLSSLNVGTQESMTTDISAETFSNTDANRSGRYSKSTSMPTVESPVPTSLASAGTTTSGSMATDTKVETPSNTDSRPTGVSTVEVPTTPLLYSSSTAAPGYTNCTHPIAGTPCECPPAASTLTVSTIASMAPINASSSMNWTLTSMSTMSTEVEPTSTQNRIGNYTGSASRGKTVSSLSFGIVGLFIWLIVVG